ncbi:MAG: hypothetical protein ACI9JN_000697 [Bacteroidia bacterium]|jgi:hypothetical protein
MYYVVCISLSKLMRNLIAISLISTIILLSCKGENQFGLCINEVRAIPGPLLDSNAVGDRNHVVDVVNSFEGLQMTDIRSYTFYDYVTCQQYYKGLFVFNQRVDLVIFNGKVSKIEGYIHDIELEITPTISQEFAVKIANDSFQSKSCYFIELGIIGQPSLGNSEPLARLVYDIRTRQYIHGRCLVDTHTGEVYSYSVR